MVLSMKCTGCGAAVEAGFFLSKPVLEHMLKDERALRLGGTRRDMSVLFSDIRGFTSLSERADPEALGCALNEHLTALTAVVFDRGGTLVRVKGKREPVSVYEAICEGEPDASRRAYDEACRRGIAAFRERRRDEAFEAFAGAGELRPDAKLPRLYQERIASLREQDLPDDWDGVTEFTHK